MDQPLVATVKSRSWFWPVQAGAWLLLGLLNTFIHRSAPPPPGVEVLNIITVSGGGFAITSAYRALLKRRRSLMPVCKSGFLLFAFASSAVLAVVWFVMAVLIFLPFFRQYSLSVVRLLPGAVNLYIIIIAWNLLYLGYQLVKQYHTSEVEKWQLEAEVQKAQLGALKAQINPHFLFNALNNIRALILENKEAARTMLTQFADLLRYSLQYAELKEVPLTDELHMLAQYVDLLKIQYEEKLKFVTDIKAGALAHKVPPMILQLLVENAVKHGVGQSAAGGQITVSADGTAQALEMTVRNTGSLSKNGTTLEESTGVGIANIRRRLQLIYGDQASISIGEEPPSVVVTIKITYR